MVTNSTDTSLVDHIKILFSLIERGYMVVSTVASQREGPSWGLSVWSLHVLPVYAWVLSGYSSFFPPSKNMPVRLFGDCKLFLGVSVSVHGCLSRLSLSVGLLHVFIYTMRLTGL